jgi:chemotaxis protein methyltransferase CheR
MDVTDAQFALLADVVRRRSGLLLTPDKLDLVRSKLAPVATRFGFYQVGALLTELEDEPEELARAVTQAMTTNDTMFFRDAYCFDYIATTILPSLVAERRLSRRLRIWCAAASTGQEAYSMAMLLENAGLAASGWKIDLYATDLSHEAVGRMREGVYSDYEVQRGLPISRLVECFSREGDGWRVADRLRRTLRIHEFNLLDNYGWLGRLDLVLCRNTLFYFGEAEKRDVLGRMENALSPDGWLVLGGTESVPDDCTGFAPLGTVRGVFGQARTPGWQARLAV